MSPTEEPEEFKGSRLVELLGFKPAKRVAVTTVKGVAGNVGSIPLPDGARGVHRRKDRGIVAKGDLTGIGTHSGTRNPKKIEDQE